MELITKQKCHEHLYLLRCKDAEREAWFYLLVLYDKIPIIKDFEQGKKVDIKGCYRHIEYRVEQGVVKRASGSGKDPPAHLVEWINENYGPAVIDENTTLVYTDDDIRLYTMQRSSIQQSIGVTIAYHKHEQFYYIKPTENFQNTLAFYAGVKLYDRLIEINGINIENQMDDKIMKQITNQGQLIVQLLLCNPATYLHYKTNNKQLHSNLETVKLLKPVGNNQNLFVNENPAVGETTRYCAVRWKDTTDIGVVPISSIRNLPRHIRLYELYTVENNGQCREGQIIFKGSKTDCEILLSETDINSHAKINPNISRNVGNRRPISKAASTLGLQNSESQAAKSSDGIDKQDENHEIEKRDRIIVKLVGMLMDIMHSGNDDAHRASCDGCHTLRIISDRYKCLQCEDYDLCGSCFEKRRETKQHKSGHAFAHFKMPMELFGEPITKANDEVTLSKFKERFATVEHTHVTCDGCDVEPIIGVRFKCDTCPDYDLCLECMEKQVITKTHDIKHSLVVVGTDRFNQIDINDIELGEELGRGAFGAVHKAKWISKNRQVACKILVVPPDKAHLEKSFLRELTAYTEISGAYILKLYGYAIQVDATNGIRKYLLIMEFMSRGSLTNVIKQEKKISLRRKLEMACHIASGMRKLHARNMIHRDIRPDNILVNENFVAKIGDMGIARIMEDNNNRLTVIGCRHYMPPEFVTGKYNQSLDVFTFGLTLNHLFTEKQHDSIQFIVTKVKLAEESPIFSELIARCIHNNPSQRPSAIEIEATLQAYKRGFDKIVLSKNLDYIQLSTETKNKVFLKFYEVFHPQMKVVLEREFPPPPPPSATSNTEENAVGDLFQVLSHLMDKLQEKAEKE